MGEDSACILNVFFPIPAGGAGSNDVQLVCDKLTSMSTPNSNPAETGPEAPASASDPSPTRRSFAEEAASEHGSDESVQQHMRDIAEVAAVEVITTSAVHLMSAAAVKCGLAAGDDAEELKDLDEARKLITALAGFVTAAAPEIGSQHAGPLRDGLRSLQLAFREASVIPDAPGKGPGEKFTGPVN